MSRRKNRKTPEPLHAFKVDSKQAKLFARKYSHLFAVGVQETIDDGVVVAAHNKGHDVTSAQHFGVRPGDAEEIVIDAEGVWNVDDWLSRHNAMYVCAYRPREIASQVNKSGEAVSPEIDQRGFDQPRRNDIHAAAKLARGKKIPHLAENYIDTATSAPTGP